MYNYLHRITVFTPSYNRGSYLERLYISLKKQTYTDFEWLIIDDGSVDNTQEIVLAWLTDKNDFNIRYYSQSNAGKIAAINHALDLAEGLLFFTVDSDDYLSQDALMKIHNWVEALPKDKKFCGIMGNKGISQTETPNNFFVEAYIDSDFLAITSEKVKITGERAHVFFTEVHKQYKYPFFAGEKFMTEAVAWNRMAKDGYLIRAFNDIIYIYEYLEDGLTNNSKSSFINNPKGYALWLREKSEFLHESIFKKFKMFYSYYAAVRQKTGIVEVAKNLNASILEILIISVLFKVKSIINKIFHFFESKNE